MKKYLSFFRLRFVTGLQYRAAAASGIATQFIWGFLEILVFHAFYEADPSAFPMSLKAAAAYVWLQQSFLALFATWQMDPEILDAIQTGVVAYELCRPIRIYDLWFTKNTAIRISKAVLRCFPILLVAALLPSSYGLCRPAGWMHGLLFLLSLTLGLLVTVSLCTLIQVLSLLTLSPNGLQIIFSSATEFLSGAILPLPFLPQRLRALMELLPFASMQNVPFRIYSGSMTAMEMTRAILLQAVWLLVLVLGGQLLCRRVVKKIIIQGG